MFSSSILIESLSTVDGSKSTDVSSADVETVDGVPNADEIALPPATTRSVSTVASLCKGWSDGLSIVVVAVEAAECPSSSCSFLSAVLLAVPESDDVSSFREASALLHGSILVCPIPVSDKSILFSAKSWF